MPTPAQPPPLDGALVINKPPAATSHDVVEAVRRLAGFRQIGHLGTLDPLATGVLVLLLGRATRLAQFYKARRKRYTCAIHFGCATDTYDADGQPASEDSHPVLQSAALEALAAEFTGRILQTPPAFSAKKIHGTPAHQLARKKKTVHLEPVEVEVFEFRLLSLHGQLARFSIESGSGTYVRSLAHDMGQKLGCGAHIREITRTAVGEFTLHQAVTLQQLAESTHVGNFASHVIPLEGLLLDLPSLTVLPIIERRIQHGAKFNVSVQQIKPAEYSSSARPRQGAPGSPDARHLSPGNRPLPGAPGSHQSRHFEPAPSAGEESRFSPGHLPPSDPRSHHSDSAAAGEESTPPDADRSSVSPRSGTPQSRNSEPALLAGEESRLSDRPAPQLSALAPAELNSGELPPRCLRIFNQHHRLIAIAQAVVPRTYQPVLVLEPTP